MKALLAPLLLASIATSARAGDCYGTLGFVNGAPDTIAIGSSVDVCLKGPPNELGLFMVSTGEGSLPSSYGTICLSFPLLTTFDFTFDGNGDFCFGVDIDCDPTLVGYSVYSQFLTCHPNRGLSNLAVTTVVDEIRCGDLCTYTQKDWDDKCGGAGDLLDDWFDTVFPSGLVIGDEGGPCDGDKVWAAKWKSAKKVKSYLTVGGKSGRLSWDATDPSWLPAGEIGGELLAAKLNVGFDDAGIFDDCKCRDDLKLGDLVFVKGVDSDLYGWTVRDVIALADQAISGALGCGPFDIDGDGHGDVSFHDLEDALDAVNHNFKDCKDDHGHLGLP